MSTRATILRRIRRVNLAELPTSFFRFAGQLGEKGRPCRITDTFRKAMVVQHPIDVQVFHADDPKAVYNLSGRLMREIVPFELHPFVNTGYHLTMFATLWRSLCQFGMLALNSCQRFLFTAKETRVLDCFCIGESRKGLESNIKTYLFGAFGQALGVTLTRKGDGPLACTALVKGRRFDCATYRTVELHLDRANLRQRDTMIMRDGETRLRIGETVIASRAFETRISWFLASFDSPKERLYAEVNPHRHILQHLGMNHVEGRTLFFQDRIGGLLPIATQALSLKLIRTRAVLKQVVIEPSALFKRHVQHSKLFLGWVDTILKVLSHVFSVAQFKQNVKSYLNGVWGKSTQPITSQKEGPFIPKVENQGSSGPSDKSFINGPTYLGRFWLRSVVL